MTARATKGGLGFRYGRKPWRFVRLGLLSFITLVIVGAVSGALWAVPQPGPIPIGVSPAPPICISCGCESAAHNGLRGVIQMEHEATRTHITNEFELHRNLFVVDRWFRLYVLKAMMHATQQATAVALQQMWMLGEMLDAKHQLETQRLFDLMKNTAHRDYQPSFDMCVFGTNVRSIAAAQRRGVQSAHVLSQRVLDRSLNHGDSSAGSGIPEDRRGRLVMFFERFCDVRDNNDRLKELCETPGYMTANQNQYSNKDIDYGRLVDAKLTINADFTNDRPGTGETDEYDVMELASNLYGHNVFNPPTGAILKSQPNRPTYLDVRAIAAKRSVAQNSFSTIVGMKTWGANESKDTRGYMRMLLQQLGLTDDAHIEAFLGERPSYHAQMEMLTKKLYQRPEFYTGLYDTEANITRKQAAMRAIGLMQNFDAFKSRLRNEAMLAVLLELEVENEHKNIQDRSGGTEREGPR